MAEITRKSLMHFEDLTLPKFQTIVLTANMGCADCRKRVSLITSKITGISEYTIDIRNKTVTVKADVTSFQEIEKRHLPRREAKKSPPPWTLAIAALVSMFRIHMFPKLGRQMIENLT